MVLLGILKGTRTEAPEEWPSLSKCVGSLVFLSATGTDETSGKG